MPIGNKPILEHIVQSLVSNGVTEMAMVVGHRRGMIQSHFGDGSEFGALISYYEQSKPLGTAHALLCAKDFPRGDFLVLPGDNVISPEGIKELLAAEETNCALLARSPMPSKYGVVEMSDLIVSSMDEKPSRADTSIISTGVYRLGREVLKSMEGPVSDGSTGLTDVLSSLLPELSMRGIITRGTWCDAVYPWDVIDMSSRFVSLDGQSVAGRVESGVVMKGAVEIGEGTRIRAGCYIEGPVIIGKGCDIGPHVALSPVSIIGDNVSISSFSHISGSVLLSGSSIDSHCHISRSLIDSNVQVGPHFCSASRNAYGRVKEDLIPLNDIGCVIGSNTEVGGGVSVSPGAVVGTHCRLRDGTTVRENITDRSEVY